MTDEPILRLAARALLLDPAERVLLIHHIDTDSGYAWWATPGGGIEPGETLADAASREVAEETGLRDVLLGPQIWWRETEFTYHGRRYRQREHIFAARVDAFDPKWNGLESEEHGMLDEHRWWPVAEIERSQERFAPRRLGELLRALLRDGYPSEPLDVGR